MINTKIKQMIDEVLDREGRIYTNRADDAGGPTKFGVTQATLSDWLKRPATIDDVKNLDEETAIQIFWKEYVIRPGFDKIIPLSEIIAEEVIDTGINMGPSRAARFLQRSLNALNRQGKDYSDIRVDGQVGPVTLYALTYYLGKRGKQGEAVMKKALDAWQGAFYLELAERRGFDENNLFGWFSHRIG